MARGAERKVSTKAENILLTMLLVISGMIIQFLIIILTIWQEQYWNFLMPKYEFGCRVSKDFQKDSTHSNNFSRGESSMTNIFAPFITLKCASSTKGSAVLSQMQS